MNIMTNKHLYVVISEVQFGSGPRLIRVLACPTSAELVLPSIHSYDHRYGFGYGYGNGYQSSPAFSHSCPAS